MSCIDASKESTDLNLKINLHIKDNPAMLTLYRFNLFPNLFQIPYHKQRHLLLVTLQHQGLRATEVLAELGFMGTTS